MSRVSLLFFFAALCIAFVSCTQVVRYDLSNANPVTANQFGPTSTSGCSATNLAFSGLTAVNAPGWTFTGWPTTSTRDDTKYVTFSITPNAGQPLKVKTIDFGYDIATGGPNKFDVVVSSDGTFSSASIIGTASFTANVGTNQQIGVDFSTEPLVYGTTYLRIYGYGATDANAIAGFVFAGNGKDVGVVLEADLRVVLCSCGASACPGTSQLTDQGARSCNNYQDFCTPTTNIGNIDVINVGGSSWNITTYNNNTCNEQTGSVVASCGVCTGLGMYVSCYNTCSGSSSPAGTFSSFLLEVVYSFILKFFY